MNKTTGLLLGTICLFSVLCFSAVNKLVRQTITREAEVEVSPDTFLSYKEHNITWELEHGSFAAVHTMENERAKYYQQDTTYLAIPWNKKEIRWVGVGVPISIRAWRGSLYMIVFDRESDFSKIRFRFYKEDHNVLAEIPAKEYPKEIATQNLWLRTNNGTRDGKVVNEVEIAKDLDPDDVGFRESLTAKVWYQLETGKQFYEMDSRIERSFLVDFLKRHNVEKLKEIQRTKKEKPAASQPSSLPAERGPVRLKPPDREPIPTTQKAETPAAERLRQETTVLKVKAQVPNALEQYNLSVGHYPTKEEGGLKALLVPPSDETEAAKWRGPYLKEDALKDAWGREIHYELVDPAGKENAAEAFKVWSGGKDGKSGTDDDIRSWKEKGGS